MTYRNGGEGGILLPPTTKKGRDAPAPFWTYRRPTGSNGANRVC
jgi:hypothetical protein